MTPVQTMVFVYELINNGVDWEEVRHGIQLDYNDRIQLRAEPVRN